MKSSIADKSKLVKEIKKSFNKEMNECYKHAESLESLLNNKMGFQSADYLNWEKVKDAKKTNQLLKKVTALLKKQ